MTKSTGDDMKMGKERGKILTFIKRIDRIYYIEETNTKIIIYEEACK